ncbi:MAG: 50S ribosomal protein L17 [Candidatus Omnitrophica bacterium]|nr:50S ribosomal protein L17 [Candidatus Omnitrophota bacterium]
MRHNIAGNRLNRQPSHRKATMRDMAKSVLLRERIETTLAKAKEARKTVDQLITLGKKGTLADKRRAFAVLCDHILVSALFREIAPRFHSRVGGYTRIIKGGLRRGDGAQMVYLELTEKKEVMVAKPKSKKTAVATSEVSDAVVIEKDAKKTAEDPKKTHSPREKEAPQTKADIGKKFSNIRKMFNRKTAE